MRLYTDAICGGCAAEMTLLPCDSSDCRGCSGCPLRDEPPTLPHSDAGTDASPAWGDSCMYDDDADTAVRNEAPEASGKNDDDWLSGTLVDSPPEAGGCGRRNVSVTCNDSGEPSWERVGEPAGPSVNFNTGGKLPDATLSHCCAMPSRWGEGGPGTGSAAALALAEGGLSVRERRLAGIDREREWSSRRARVMDMACVPLDDFM